MEDVAGPPLPESGHVRQLVTQTSGDQQPAAVTRLPSASRTPNPLRPSGTSSVTVPATTSPP
jgi:hypothetical protein